MTSAELQAGLQALSTTSLALSGQLGTVGTLEAVAGDAEEIVNLIDPATIPFDVLLPIAEWLIVWLVANNKLHQQRMLPTDHPGQPNG